MEMLWNLANDSIYRVLKIVVNHFISFIKHYEVALIEYQGPLCQEVLDTTWRSNDNFNSSRNYRALFFGRFATNNNHRAQVRVFRQLDKFFFDLLG